MYRYRRSSTGRLALHHCSTDEAPSSPPRLHACERAAMSLHQVKSSIPRPEKCGPCLRHTYQSDDRATPATRTCRRALRKPSSFACLATASAHTITQCRGCPSTKHFHYALCSLNRLKTSNLLAEAHVILFLYFTAADVADIVTGFPSDPLPRIRAGHRSQSRPNCRRAPTPTLSHDNPRRP